MIKTLRITGILAVILAGGFFVFPVFFGVRGDEQVEEFLNSTGILEEFNRAKDGQESSQESQSFPLVKQAEAFARFLNPPQPTITTTPSISAQPTITQRPPMVSAKFALIGTCYYQSNPQQSLAFIDESGKGLHWIRQSDQVQHLIIEQIKDGFVVVRDGQRTFEINVEQRTQRRSLLEGASFTDTDIDSQLTSQPTSAITDVDRPRFISSTESATQISEEESAAFQKLIDKLRDLQKVVKSEKTDSTSKPEDKAALMEKLISDFKASRVSPEEARNLGDLGKTLNDINKDKDIVDEKNSKIEK